MDSDQLAIQNQADLDLHCSKKVIDFLKKSYVHSALTRSYMVYVLSIQKTSFLTTYNIYFG